MAWSWLRPLCSGAAAAASVKGSDMARIVQGAVGGPASGSLGNVVFSRGRAGAVLRVRRIPKKRVTEKSAQWEAFTVRARRHWRTLTDAQRASWDTFAAEHPSTDALGQSRIPRGYDVYVQHAVYCLRAGGALLHGCPQMVLQLPVAGFLVRGDDPPFTLRVSWTYPVTLGTKFRVFLYARTAGTEGRLARAKWRLIRVWKPAGTSEYVTSDFLAAFGEFQVGQWVEMKMTYIQNERGNIAPWGHSTCQIS